MTDKESRLVIRNVSEEVQKTIRVLAAEHNITMAEALALIVAEWKAGKLKSD